MTSVVEVITGVGIEPLGDLGFDRMKIEPAWIVAAEGARHFAFGLADFEEDWGGVALVADSMQFRYRIISRVGNRQNYHSMGSAAILDREELGYGPVRGGWWRGALQLQLIPSTWGRQGPLDTDVEHFIFTIINYLLARRPILGGHNASIIYMDVDDLTGVELGNPAHATLSFRGGYKATDQVGRILEQVYLAEWAGANRDNGSTVSGGSSVYNHTIRVPYDTGDGSIRPLLFPRAEGGVTRGWGLSIPIIYTGPVGGWSSVNDADTGWRSTLNELYFCTGVRTDTDGVFQTGSRRAADLSRTFTSRRVVEGVFDERRELYRAPGFTAAGAEARAAREYRRHVISEGILYIGGVTMEELGGARVRILSGDLTNIGLLDRGGAVDVLRSYEGGFGRSYEVLSAERTGVGEYWVSIGRYI